jgi:glycerol-3-phosphate dehydrogenase
MDLIKGKKAVAIIGIGVIECAIARELSKFDLDISISEKVNDTPGGASKTNFVIVYAMYGDVSGTVKGKLCVLGNALFTKLKEELDFSFKRNSSLMVALTDEEVKEFCELLEKGKKNGVTSLQILNKEETLKLELNFNPSVISKSGGEMISMFTRSAGSILCLILQLVKLFLIRYSMHQQMTQKAFL